MSRRSGTSLVFQLIAATLCLTTARFSLGAPGDVLSSAGPVIGSDPPAGTSIGAGDATVSPQTGALKYSYPIGRAAGASRDGACAGSQLLIASATARNRGCRVEPGHSRDSARLVARSLCTRAMGELPWPAAN